MQKMKKTPKTDLTTESVVTINYDNLLPIEKMNQSDLSKLDKDEKELRATLLEDLEKAQFYTAVSIYYFVKVGKHLLTIKKLKENNKNSFKKIIESVGLRERTAFRYISLAQDSRFASMSEDNFKSLHHLNQTKMIMMTKYDDDTFNEAINNENFAFPKEKKEKEIKKPSEYSISDETYKELMQYEITYVIQKYDLLYKELIELKKQEGVQ